MRIVVTRAASQQEELSVGLRAVGAQVISLPLIEIAPPADPRPLQQAAGRVDEWDWIIFTSANAVHAFSAGLRVPPQQVPAKIAVVGSATEREAITLGFHPSVVPEQYVAESLLKALPEGSIHGARVLIPRSALARDEIPDELRKLGARVETVEAYRNVLPPGSWERAQEIFADPYPDWVLFASPSAVDHFMQVCHPDQLGSTRVGSIGPVTTACLKRHGLTVDAEARPHTSEGLVAMLLTTPMGSFGDG